VTDKDALFQYTMYILSSHDIIALLTIFSPLTGQSGIGHFVAPHQNITKRQLLEIDEVFLILNLSMMQVCVCNMQGTEAK
jgi:hypothetical protein